MKAIITKNTITIDYPFIEILKGTIIEIIGSETEDKTVAIRYNGHNCLVNIYDLKEINDENLKWLY